MSRLPSPGSDDNTWGTILNDYLSVSLNSDGTLRSGAVADANSSSKGIIQLAGDLGGTASNPTVPGKANDSSVVHNTGNENVAGIKNFSNSPVVPDPTNDTDAANKRYVDASSNQIHSKSLVNNTDNAIFTLPLASGEIASVHIFSHVLAKKGTDWAFVQYDWVGSMYNDGSVLQKIDGLSADILSREQASNGGSVTFSGIGTGAFTFTFNSGIVTCNFNPSNVGVSPDSIVIEYVVINPAGKVLTYL